MSGARCACCLSTRSVPHLAGLLRCTRCGHCWADMRLSDEELRQLYAANYFEGDEYLDYAMERAALQRNFRPRLEELARRHPRGSRLLEIGCAYGFFLEAARRRFRVRGCEISAHAAAHAREQLGLRVHVGDYLDVAAPKRPYDIACLWDTIEHLRDPHLYLEKVAGELAPGGTLAFSTGDIGSLLARWRGARWRLIHPPTHLHYFTAGSARALLERLGFQHVEVFHPPSWRHADAVAYRLLAHGRQGAGPALYRGLSRTGLLEWSFPLNTGDLMAVYATR